jgi:tellurite methyltransferase
VHALLTFVDHPDVPLAPDWSENEFLYAPGELRGYYAGWRILHTRSFIFEDDSGGEPHEHAVEEYVFQKL